MKLFRRSRGDQAPGGEHVAPLPPRQWTLMVFLAGDNNLEEYGRSDLLEMKKAGSTDQVALVAQLDRLGDGGARRYYLTAGDALDADVVQTLPETNTGDPRVLAQFIRWAMQTYPAQRYGLVLWNHGTGWKENDVYRIARSAGLYRPERERTLSPLVARMVDPDTRPPLFASTLNAVLARGIAYDDTSADFLDNAELKGALGNALMACDVERLDLLGFDACLMSMLEVAYQLRDETAIMVGSQEIEPGVGWPYDAILQGLVSHPSWSAQELAEMIVKSYDASCPPEAAATQSALDLSQMRDVVLALSDLCRYVIEHEDTCELTVGRVSRTAQRYSDPDYKDLYDFCRLIAERGETEQVKELAAAVMGLLAPAGRGRFVCAEAHHGSRVGRSHGVSIYFPGHEMSPFYKRLDFSSECLWDDMLRRLFGVA